MSKRVALILALIAAAGVMVTMSPFAVNSRLAARLQVTAEPGSLAWYAQTAQAQGLAAYNFSAGIGEYPLPTWDNAVANSSVVVAQLISAKSYPSGYAVNNQYVENSIITWYKFRVLESWQQRDVCGSCSGGSLQPPGELLPLNADEILLRRAGGTVVVDGIALNSTETEFPQVPVGARCILLFQKDPTQQESWLWLGPNSVYPIISEDLFGTVSALDATGGTTNKNPYTDELQNRYANSVSSLRASLTGISSTPTPTPFCNVPFSERQDCVNSGGYWDNEICACSY